MSDDKTNDYIKPANPPPSPDRGADDPPPGYYVAHDVGLGLWLALVHPIKTSPETRGEAVAACEAHLANVTEKAAMWHDAWTTADARAREAEQRHIEIVDAMGLEIATWRGEVARLSTGLRDGGAYRQGYKEARSLVCEALVGALALCGIDVADQEPTAIVAAVQADRVQREREHVADLARAREAGRQEGRRELEREFESGLVMLGLCPGSSDPLDLVATVGRALGERREAGREDGRREVLSLLYAHLAPDYEGDETYVLAYDDEEYPTYAAAAEARDALLAAPSPKSTGPAPTEAAPMGGTPKRPGAMPQCDHWNGGVRCTKTHGHQDHHVGREDNSLMWWSSATDHTGESWPEDAEADHVAAHKGGTPDDEPCEECGGSGVATEPPAAPTEPDSPLVQGCRARVSLRWVRQYIEGLTGADTWAATALEHIATVEHAMANPAAAPLGAGPALDDEFADENPAADGHTHCTVCRVEPRKGEYWTHCGRCDESVCPTHQDNTDGETWCDDCRAEDAQETLAKVAAHFGIETDGPRGLTVAELAHALHDAIEAGRLGYGPMAAPSAPQAEALRFIADQPCREEAEGAGPGFPCSETGACATEWCHPCYARAHLHPASAPQGGPNAVVTDAHARAASDARDAWAGRPSVWERLEWQDRDGPSMGKGGGENRPGDGSPPAPAAESCTHPVKRLMVDVAAWRMRCACGATMGDGPLPLDFDVLAWARSVNLGPCKGCGVPGHRCTMPALPTPYQLRVGDTVEWTERGTVTNVMRSKHHSAALVDRGPGYDAEVKAWDRLRPTNDEPGHVVSVARPQYDDPRRGYVIDERDTTAGQTIDEPGEVE